MIIFPGQGTQFQGMGKELYDNSQICKNIYEKAKNIIGKELIELSFDGSMTEISETKNSQPLIVLYSLALYYHNKKKLNDNVFAGHSLGELSALGASEYIDFETLLKFVKFRGEVMQDSFSGKGSMYALLLPKLDLIEEQLENYDNLFLANYNSYSQVVISGSEEEGKQFVDENKGELFRKGIKLKVNKPFHTPFMKDAKDLLKRELENIDISFNNNIVFSNVTGKSYEKDYSSFIELLSSQVSSSVKWIDIIENCKQDKFIEIGPKAILGAFVSSINKKSSVNPIIKIDN